MAPAELTIEIRSRRVWILYLANVITILPTRLYQPLFEWLWSYVVFEYRSGKQWLRLPNPVLVWEQE